MKNYASLLLLCGILLIFSSCYISYPVQTYTPSPVNSYDNTRLMDLPTTAHHREVEVFFPGENPKNPYLKVFLLEEVAYEETSYATLVGKLKKQAQRKGVDAIIVLARNRSETETEIAYTVTNMASAVGIVYTKNIEYKENVAKRSLLSLYNHETNEYEVTEVFKLNAENKPIPKENSYQYLAYFYNYSLDFMLNEKNANWQYIYNSKKKVIKRYYKGITAVFSFEISDSNKVKKVTILNDSGTYEIDFSYNKDGFFHQKKIYRVASSKKRKLIRNEVFEYKDNGQLLRQHLFKFDKEDGSIVPFMKLEYEYYSEADYKKILEKATR